MQIEKRLDGWFGMRYFVKSSLTHALPFFNGSPFLLRIYFDMTRCGHNENLKTLCPMGEVFVVVSGNRVAGWWWHQDMYEGQP